MAVKEGGKHVAKITAKEWVKEAGKETAVVRCPQQALKWPEFLLNKNIVF